jgi:hypothetical protein
VELKRELPPAPEFARPVADPVHRVGSPMITIAGREKAGRLQANKIIVEYNEWYEAVRRSYSGAAE